MAEVVPGLPILECDNFKVCIDINGRTAIIMVINVHARTGIFAVNYRTAGQVVASNVAR